jgi:anaerobic selenocysteine-containing dehydrogenase
MGSRLELFEQIRRDHQREGLSIHELERGARLVVIHPYLSDTAARAQEWVAIRPGHRRRPRPPPGARHHRRPARQGLRRPWTSGFDDYAAYVADKTPAWAEGITSVPAATIERLAHELATTRPAGVDTWSGPGQHSNAVQSGRAIALLNALVGSWGPAGREDNPRQARREARRGQARRYGRADPRAAPLRPAQELPTRPQVRRVRPPVHQPPMAAASTTRRCSCAPSRTRSCPCPAAATSPRPSPSSRRSSWSTRCCPRRPCWPTTSCPAPPTSSATT